jgi:hypothetical protein
MDLTDLTYDTKETKDCFDENDMRYWAQGRIQDYIDQARAAVFLAKTAKMWDEGESERKKYLDIATKALYYAGELCDIEIIFREKLIK